MIFAMSDIHGHYTEFMQAIHNLDDLSTVKEGRDKLILLGDYIDNGPESYKVVKKIYDLQRECGKEQVIAVRGNHEKWFLDFLYTKERDWLGEDWNLNTSRTFLMEEQLEKVKELALKEGGDAAYNFIRELIRNNHKELIEWMYQLPYYYATETQVFVHAGVDEEAGEFWQLGTSNYFFVEKFPPSYGTFCKDIIAGHVSTSSFVKEHNFHDVVWDGQSHYYIDGSVRSGRRIPILVYDENEKRYYSLEGNLREGKMKEVKVADRYANSI